MFLKSIDNLVLTSGTLAVAFGRVEAVEVIIEAKDNNDELFLNESADLLFHYLILLQAKGYKLNNVVEILEKRNKC